MKKGKAPTTDCCELSMTVPDIQVLVGSHVVLENFFACYKKFGVKMAVCLSCSNSGITILVASMRRGSSYVVGQQFVFHIFKCGTEWCSLRSMNRYFIVFS